MKDAWPIYFGQLNEHLIKIKSYVFSNIDDESFDNHIYLKYNNDDPYFKQYLGCIKDVDNDYVIYAQEDFFLYGDVTLESLQKYCQFLKDTDYSFVRLIRAGYKTPLDNHISDDLYEVDINSNDAFTMQATLWKKNRLIDLYSHTESEKWYEGDAWNASCRELNIKGVLTYNGENKRGKFHYDSSVYPYTCTGINKGHWNMHQYELFLMEMFKKYNVSASQRGVRVSDTKYIK